MKCLGIVIGTDNEACKKLNWEKTLNEIERLAFQWCKRKLTLQGKITVINTLIVPKLIYPMTVLYTPIDVLNRVEEIIYKLLWEKITKFKKQL